LDTVLGIYNIDH